MATWEPTEAELTALRSEYARGSTDAQWEIFLGECRSRNLRIGQHLVFQLRKAKEYDAVTGAYMTVNKAFWITTISALRLIIERTGKYAGQTQPEYIYLDADGQPTVISTIPLPQKDSDQIPREPWAVRVGIKRKDFDEPIYGLARFEAVATFTKTHDGKTTLSSMWAKRGPEMTAKCAEADGIRKAAPEEAGAYFIAEELKNDDEPTLAAPVQTLTPAPSAPIVPKVDQTPATPTDAPRPGEEKPIPTLVELILDKPVPPVTLTEEGDATPIETKKKPGRPKKEASPDNGKSEEPKKAGHDREDLGITQEDIDNAQKPQNKMTAEEDAALLADSMAFAEDVGSATPTPDLLPTKEQKDKFVAHVREIVAAGVDNKLLGAYICGRVNKQKSSELTVGEWESAFVILDAAKEAGTLKEVVKPV